MFSLNYLLSTVNINEMGDEEESEWTSSNIKGYDFEDDDQVFLNVNTDIFYCFLLISHILRRFTKNWQSIRLKYSPSLLEDKKSFSYLLMELQVHRQVVPHPGLFQTEYVLLHQLTLHNWTLLNVEGSV